jgi:O-antigen/teichoic acid export membrane protein
MALSRAIAKRVLGRNSYGGAVDSEDQLADRHDEPIGRGPARSPLARNLAFLAGGQLVTWVLTAVWTIVVPRSLGPSGMGQLTIAWSAVAIINVICTVGTDVLVAKEVARDRSRAAAMVGSGIALRLSSVPIGWLLIVAYISLTHFGLTQIVILVLATGAMQLSLVTSVMSAAFQGLERMEYIAYADVFSKSLMTVASIALVLSGFGVVAIMALSLSIAAVVLVLMLRWSHRHFPVTLSLDLGGLIEMLKGGVPFWATSLFLTAYIWIDSVMLTIMTNETVVGWYGAPTKLFAALLFVPAVMSTAWFPRLVAAFGQGGDHFREVLGRVLSWTVILSLPIAAGLVAVSPALISLLYGPRFADSIGVLAILGLLLPFTYLNIVASLALAASNRQMIWTKVMAAATVINPLINVGLIPLFQARWQNGALGAALSLLATEILMSVAALFLVRHSLWAVSLSRVSNALLASLLMGAITFLLQPFGLLVQVAAGGVSFAVLALLLQIPAASEMTYALNLGRRVWGRFSPQQAAS